MDAEFQQGDQLIKMTHGDTYGDKFQELLNQNNTNSHYKKPHPMISKIPTGEKRSHLPMN